MIARKHTFCPIFGYLVLRDAMSHLSKWGVFDFLLKTQNINKRFSSIGGRFFVVGGRFPIHVNLRKLSFCVFVTENLPPTTENLPPIVKNYVFVFSGIRRMKISPHLLKYLAGVLKIRRNQVFFNSVNKFHGLSIFHVFTDFRWFSCYCNSSLQRYFWFKLSQIVF
jgi:hypothetical protein